jgi:hypothetical protein
MQIFWTQSPPPVRVEIATPSGWYVFSSFSEGVNGDERKEEKEVAEVTTGVSELEVSHEEYSEESGSLRNHSEGEKSRRG